MLTERQKKSFPHPALVLGTVGVVFGIAAGLLAGAGPLYLSLIFVASAVLIYFFTNFEYAVLGFLVLRSSLDIFLPNKSLPHLRLELTA